MIIIGIDPSMKNTGVAVAEVDVSTKTISSILRLQLFETEPSNEKSVRKSSDYVRRARIASEGIEAIIGEFKPKAYVAEVPHGAQSASAAISNGICIGILAGLRLPLIQVTANQVKMATAGKKTASKLDMIRYAYERFPDADWMTRKGGQPGIGKPGAWLVNKNEHIADAICAIEAGLKTDDFKLMATFA